MFKAKTPSEENYAQKACRLVGGELEFQAKGHEFKTWHNQFLFLFLKIEFGLQKLALNFTRKGRNLMDSSKNGIV